MKSELWGGWDKKSHPNKYRNPVESSGVGAEVIANVENFRGQHFSSIFLNHPTHILCFTIARD